MPKKIPHIEGQDLTKGHIPTQLWSLAWPMMISVFFHTLYNLVDAFWVSKISAEAIAAVSISQITLFVMISLGFGITVGSGVIMSMHIGAKEIGKAESVLGQAFVLSTIIGALLTPLLLIFKTPLLIASGANGLILAPALSYFTISAAGSILFFLLITVMFIFNAQGDTITLTRLFALSTLINLVMDPILIFGLLGFPALGISGAAIATLISQAIFILIALQSLSHKNRLVRFHFKNLTLKLQSVKKVLKIGIPAALTQVIFPLGLAALTFLTSQSFNEEGAIAFSLGFRMEFFAFLPAIGFGFGAMAMMGQNIGAGNKERALEVLKKALLFGFIGAAGIGLTAAVFANNIIAIFTTDPLVTSYARSYMHTVALSYGFLAIMMVEANAFQAVGRSWPGFLIAIIRFGVISIPLSYILTVIFNLPITAIWGAIIAGNIISSVIGYIWVTGTLKNIKLKEVPVHR